MKGSNDSQVYSVSFHFLIYKWGRIGRFKWFARLVSDIKLDIDTVCCDSFNHYVYLEERFRRQQRQDTILFIK